MRKGSLGRLQSVRSQRSENPDLDAIGADVLKVSRMRGGSVLQIISYNWPDESLPTTSPQLERKRSTQDASRDVVTQSTTQEHQTASAMMSSTMQSTNPKFKQLLDRTSQTRHLLAVNQASIRTQFSSRVKAEEEKQILRNRHILQRSKDLINSESREAIRIKTEQILQTRQQCSSQPSSRLAEVRGGSIYSERRQVIKKYSAIDARDLTCQVQNEQENMKVAGHRSRMTFKKNTFSK